MKKIRPMSWALKNDLYFQYLRSHILLIELNMDIVKNNMVYCHKKIKNIDKMPINQFLDREQSLIRPIFISSYVPTKCGIATFTKDLTKSLNDLNPEGLAEIIALDGDNSEIYYPWEVKYRILRHDIGTYFQAAEYINQSTADIVCLQHEFGLFGGEDGEYILNLIRKLNKPVIVTLHTVLSSPSISQKSIIKCLSELSKSFVVMVPEIRTLLIKEYDVNPEKVAVIHHGVADYPKSAKTLKKFFHWQNKQILLSTGLINEGKGLEYVIKALPKIVEQFPSTYFYIIGQTHPEIIQKEGERYRRSLVALAKAENMLSHVKFINEYLPLDKLLRYYEACDIYITPHLNPEQSSSGTLAYALGMGKVCVSTPYLYAKRVLANNHGLLVDFKNPKHIFEAVTSIFRDPSLESRLTDNAYSLGRTMCWPRVAQRYLNLFKYVIQNEKNITETPSVSNG